jgi:hypothetical protein
MNFCAKYGIIIASIIVNTALAQQKESIQKPAPPASPAPPMHRAEAPVPPPPPPAPNLVNERVNIAPQPIEPVAPPEPINQATPHAKKPLQKKMVMKEANMKKAVITEKKDQANCVRKYKR